MGETQEKETEGQFQELKLSFSDAKKDSFLHRFYKETLKHFANFPDTITPIVQFLPLQLLNIKIVDNNPSPTLYITLLQLKSTDQILKSKQRNSKFLSIHLNIIIIMSKELFSILQEIPNPKDYPQVLTQPQRILTSKYTKDVKLELLVNRDGKLFLETYNDNTKISSREFQTPANFPIVNILMNFEVSGTLFFVSCSPIRLFMCFQGTSLITPITFPKPIPAHSSFSCHINFPSLFIFGGLDCNNRPLQDFIELNLMTFEWQNLSQSYSPSPRHSHLSYLKDDRLYVWGGLDEKNRPVDDKLLWTFDFEKSYWFALEMASPVLMDAREFKMVERQDNRLTVLDVRDCAVYGVDVFQSAVRQEKCSRRMGLLDENSRFVDKLIDMRDRFEGIILSKGTLYKLLIFSKYEAMMQYQMKNHMSDC